MIVLFRQDRLVSAMQSAFANQEPTHGIKLSVQPPGDEILKHVWGYDILATARSVDRCVNTLRSKIEKDPDRPIYIKTIRDVGYRFEI
jgi:hypothetical protein